MKPVVHGLELEFDDKIEFVYLDIDDPATDELKNVLGYTRQPEVYLLDGAGTVVAEWAGAVDEATLRSGLEALQ